jgi:oxygen-independent coproporphyrinogen-3 oxidase
MSAQRRHRKFNLDLMYGLPAQTLQQALADLDAALALEPTHISHYQLTLEPGTVFYHRPRRVAGLGRNLADAAGLSGEARVARLRALRGFGVCTSRTRSRHNLNYWRFGDYIGVGAGAHGKLTWLRAKSERDSRSFAARVKQPREFLRRAAADRISDRFAVAAESCRSSIMLNVLR